MSWKFTKLKELKIYSPVSGYCNKPIKDKVILLGDASRVFSPHSGQGLSTSSIDSLNLYWKLIYVIKYDVNKKLLTSYTNERVLAWKTALRNVNFIKKVHERTGFLASIISNYYLPLLLPSFIRQQIFSKQICKYGNKLKSNNSLYSQDDFSIIAYGAKKKVGSFIDKDQRIQVININGKSRISNINQIHEFGHLAIWIPFLHDADRLSHFLPNFFMFILLLGLIGLYNNKYFLSIVFIIFMIIIYNSKYNSNVNKTVNYNQLNKVITKVNKNIKFPMNNMILLPQGTSIYNHLINDKIKIVIDVESTRSSYLPSIYNLRNIFNLCNNDLCIFILVSPDDYIEYRKIIDINKEKHQNSILDYFSHHY